MIEGAALKALLRRPIAEVDLPIVVKRKRWPDGLALVLLPFLAAFTCVAFWVGFAADTGLEWPFRVLFVVLGLLLVLGCYGGIQFFVRLPVGYR